MARNRPRAPSQARGGSRIPMHRMSHRKQCSAPVQCTVPCKQLKVLSLGPLLHQGIVSHRIPSLCRWQVCMGPCHGSAATVHRKICSIAIRGFSVCLLGLPVAMLAMSILGRLIPPPPNYTDRSCSLSTHTQRRSQSHSGTHDSPKWSIDNEKSNK